jgi:hypothetical protein
MDENLNLEVPSLTAVANKEAEKVKTNSLCASSVNTIENKEKKETLMIVRLLVYIVVPRVLCRSRRTQEKKKNAYDAHLNVYSFFCRVFAHELFFFSVHILLIKYVLN